MAIPHNPARGTWKPTPKILYSDNPKLFPGKFHHHLEDITSLTPWGEWERRGRVAKAEAEIEGRTASFGAQKLGVPAPREVREKRVESKEVMVVPVHMKMKLNKRDLEVCRWNALTDVEKLKEMGDVCLRAKLTRKREMNVTRKKCKHERNESDEDKEE
jgi:hypothetical protein